MRVLLAAARRESIFALMYLLSREPSIEVVCEVSDASSSIDNLALSAAVNVVLSGNVDAVVLDLDDSQLDDGEHGAFMALCQMVPVVAVSARPEMQNAVLRLGGERFVYKSDPPARLLDALRRLSSELCFTNDVAYQRQSLPGSR